MKTDRFRLTTSELFESGAGVGSIKILAECEMWQTDPKSSKYGSDS
jgi:hypothetical protein